MSSFQAKGRLKEMGQGEGQVEKVIFENLKWLGGRGELGTLAVCSYVAVKNSPETGVKARLISL